MIRSGLEAQISGHRQLDADILAFRHELARGQRLLESFSSALEACHRETDVQQFLLRISGLFDLILVTVIALLWGRRSRTTSELAIADQPGSESVVEVESAGVGVQGAPPPSESEGQPSPFF